MGKWRMRFYSSLYYAMAMFFLMNQRNTVMDITKVGEGFSLIYDIKSIE